MKNILAIMVTVVCSTMSSAAAASSHENPVDKHALLRVVNAARKSGTTCGSTRMPAAHALAWNGTLEKAALLHAQDMSRLNYFSHTGKDGSNPGQRITRLGYKWQTYAENIAAGQQNEQEVMASWLQSEGHCKNIMNPDVQELGVAKSGDKWVMVFGKQW